MRLYKRSALLLNNKPRDCWCDRAPRMDSSDWHLDSRSAGVELNKWNKLLSPSRLAFIYKYGLWIPHPQSLLSCAHPSFPFHSARRATRYCVHRRKGGYKEGWDDTKDDVYSLFACAGLLARSKHSARTILYTHRGKCLWWNSKSILK